MDNALKQRMVGATVLIALAVIVLPMLLGGRPEGSAPEPEEIDLPQEPPELSFETRRYPIGETADQERQPDSSSQNEQRTPQLPAPRIVTPDVTPDAAGPVKQPAGEPAANDLEVSGLGPAPGEAVDDAAVNAGTGSEPEPESEPTATADPLIVEPEVVSSAPTPVTGRYVVQVASFGAADNANRLSKQLSSGGYSVMTDTVKSDVGTLHRVRIGPYDSESEARKAVVALSSTIDGVKPRVMDLHPHQAAQVTSPDDPLVRWVVQVGSFSSSANADGVVAKLRLQGMSAYQETVSSAGKEIFRVRVGPFLSRDDAVKTEREVSEKLSVKAVVMTTD